MTAESLDRFLLAHKREIRRLQHELEQPGTTLIPLTIYFKDGYAKVELGVGKGKQEHDKRATMRDNEQKRDMRRITSRLDRNPGGYVTGRSRPEEFEPK